MGDVIFFPFMIVENVRDPVTIPAFPELSRFRVTLSTGELRVVRAENLGEARTVAWGVIPDLGFGGVAIARIEALAEPD
jgi:hypothetical protein